VAAVIWPVQQIIGNPSDPVTKPATKAMVQAAMFDLVPVLMYFKSVFNRGRPHHCCDLKIDPMFARPDRLYPGHPAYPSGHSTQAHVIAFLYGDMFPKQEQALLEAALRVGQNREVAGLHYPSDTLAGRELARKFVDTMKGVPAFHTLWLTAKAEWPEVALRP
jgi:acid phosphatase (class A)